MEEAGVAPCMMKSEAYQLDGLVEDGFGSVEGLDGVAAGEQVLDHVVAHIADAQEAHILALQGREETPSNHSRYF